MTNANRSFTPEQRANFGRRLRMARKRSGKTQDEVSRETEISRQMIALYEKGSNNPPDKVIEYYASIAGVEVQWLYSDAPPPPVVTVAMPKKFGVSVILPLWNGVMAGGGSDEYFESTQEYYEVPYFFLGDTDPSQCCMIKVTGFSMRPRIEYGSHCIVKFTKTPPMRSLVVARDTESNTLRVKVLHPADPPARGFKLKSIDPDHEDIHDLTGYETIGGIIFIRSDSVTGQPNIEWNDGKFLMA